MNNKIECICGSTIRARDKARHEKTKIHLNFINNSNDAINNDIYEADSVDIDSAIDDKPNNDFLDELTKENYNISVENDRATIQNEIMEQKIKAEQDKIFKKVKNNIKDDSSDDFFSGKPTEIIGLESRTLLAKVKQYKILFPNELKGFKIKKKPTTQELQACLDEMDAIVSTNSVDNFITDGILQSLSVIEGISTRTNYNISGLSMMLKNNPQFHSLSKQLYVKYGTFSSIGPEYQLIFLVATSCYICRQKNASRNQMEEYLSEPANI